MPAFLWIDKLFIEKQKLYFCLTSIDKLVN